MVTQIPQISQISFLFMLFRGFWLICGISEICVNKKLIYLLWSHSSHRSRRFIISSCCFRGFWIICGISEICVT